MDDRTTSYAKSVETPDYTDARLAQAQRLGLSFEQAKGSANGQSAEQSDTQGSKMVEGSKTAANMRPPEEIARPVDRQKFNQDWAAEQRQANTYQGRRESQLDRFNSRQADERPGSVVKEEGKDSSYEDRRAAQLDRLQRDEQSTKAHENSYTLK